MGAKTALNLFLMRYCAKSIAKGDVEYKTEGNPYGSGFMCTLRLPIVAALENGSEVPEFIGESDANEKMAEQAAARKVLDHFADWIAANPAAPKEAKQKRKAVRDYQIDLFKWAGLT